MRVFLYLIFNIIKIIKNNNNIKNSQDKISFNDKFFKELILFNLLPIKTVNKITGVKPNSVESINLKIDTLSNEKIVFCNINGGPGIILKIIKYSNVESEI